MKKIALIIFTMIISCSGNESKNGEEVKKGKVVSNISELIVERGAYHYDKFVLKNNEISFLEYQENTKSYKLINKKKIDKKLVQVFFDKIVDKGIFKLNTKYKSDHSCSTLLNVSFTDGNKKIDIKCEDWQTNCPELLKFIELEIVKLQGEERIRTILPG